MKRIILLACLFFLSWSAIAQDSLRLDFMTYMEWVKLNHPVAIQAELTLRLGNTEVLKARGGFDPMLFGYLDKKEFNQSTYFEKREAGVVIPTWMGVELNGNFEQNNGRFVNLENSLPSNGLLSAGASVNLGQGLMFDDRRAMLRKAQLYQQATEAERSVLLNELHLQATDAYWRWAAAYENKQVLQEGLTLAKIRFEAVKRSFDLGDQAAIDTVEALSQLLNREYRLQTAENELFSSSQLLSTFLWSETGEPMVLDQAIVPQDLFEQRQIAPDEEELRSMVSAHPVLRLTDVDLASLNVEKRLKTQELLPVMKLKYNFLTENIAGARPSPFLENNYKWGVTLYSPLLLRSTRGALGQTKAKIEIKQTGRDLKELELRRKLEADLNAWKILNNQVATIRTNVKTLEALLQGETRRFSIGESSLFLVNAREVAVFDSRITLNDLAAKLRTAYAKTRFSAGLGFEEN